MPKFTNHVPTRSTTRRHVPGRLEPAPEIRNLPPSTSTNQNANISPSRCRRLREVSRTAAWNVNISPHEFLILAQIFPLTLISGVSFMYSDFRFKENDRYSNFQTELYYAYLKLTFGWNILFKIYFFRQLRLGCGWWRFRRWRPPIPVFRRARFWQSSPKKKIRRSGRKTPSCTHGLHLRAAGQPREQVQDHPLPLRVWKAQLGPDPQSNRDTGQNLVPKQKNKMEKTEPRVGCQLWQPSLPRPCTWLFLPLSLPSWSSSLRPLLPTSGLSLSCGSSCRSSRPSHQPGQPADAPGEHLQHAHHVHAPGHVQPRATDGKSVFSFSPALPPVRFCENR